MPPESEALDGGFLLPHSPRPDDFRDLSQVKE